MKKISSAGAAASSLPHGDQRKLEVAMLIALEPSVYMFDEPTAGMSTADVPVILDLIRGLKAEADKTMNDILRDLYAGKFDPLRAMIIRDTFLRDLGRLAVWYPFRWCVAAAPRRW